ncbi:hypothetical protein HDU79_007648 [Rhizoclosmatium sp. JEL0117]|nr:hypothetical protein HDU79_007648 [Rhizoclosmatium sp. JEL0117]
MECRCRQRVRAEKRARDKATRKRLRAAATPDTIDHSQDGPCFVCGKHHDCRATRRTCQLWVRRKAAKIDHRLSRYDFALEKKKDSVTRLKQLVLRETIRTYINSLRTAGIRFFTLTTYADSPHFDRLNLVPQLPNPFPVKVFASDGKSCVIVPVLKTDTAATLKANSNLVLFGAHSPAAVLRDRVGRVLDDRALISDLLASVPNQDRTLSVSSRLPGGADQPPLQVPAAFVAALHKKPEVVGQMMDDSDDDLSDLRKDRASFIAARGGRRESHFTSGGPLEAVTNVITLYKDSRTLSAVAAIPASQGRVAFVPPFAGDAFPLSQKWSNTYTSQSGSEGSTLRYGDTTDTGYTTTDAGNATTTDAELDCCKGCSKMIPSSDLIPDGGEHFCKDCFDTRNWDVGNAVPLQSGRRYDLILSSAIQFKSLSLSAKKMLLVESQSFLTKSIAATDSISNYLVESPDVCVSKAALIIPSTLETQYLEAIRAYIARNYAPFELEEEASSESSSDAVASDREVDADDDNEDEDDDDEEDEDEDEDDDDDNDDLPTERIPIPGTRKRGWGNVVHRDIFGNEVEKTGRKDTNAARKRRNKARQAERSANPTSQWPPLSNFHLYNAIPGDNNSKITLPPHFKPLSPFSKIRDKQDWLEAGDALREWFRMVAEADISRVEDRAYFNFLALHFRGFSCFTDTFKALLDGYKDMDVTRLTSFKSKVDEFIQCRNRKSHKDADAQVRYMRYYLIILRKHVDGLKAKNDPLGQQSEDFYWKPTHTYGTIFFQLLRVEPKKKNAVHDKDLGKKGALIKCAHEAFHNFAGLLQSINSETIGCKKDAKGQCKDHRKVVEAANIAWVDAQEDDDWDRHANLLLHTKDKLLKDEYYRGEKKFHFDRPRFGPHGHDNWKYWAITCINCQTLARSNELLGFDEIDFLYRETAACEDARDGREIPTIPALNVLVKGTKLKQRLAKLGIKDVRYVTLMSTQDPMDDVAFALANVKYEAYLMFGDNPPPVQDGYFAIKSYKAFPASDQRKTMSSKTYSDAVKAAQVSLGTYIRGKVTHVKRSVLTYMLKSLGVEKSLIEEIGWMVEDKKKNEKPTVLDTHYHRDIPIPVQRALAYHPAKGGAIKIARRVPVPEELTRDFWPFITTLEECMKNDSYFVRYDSNQKRDRNTGITSVDEYVKTFKYLAECFFQGWASMLWNKHCTEEHKIFQHCPAFRLPAWARFKDAVFAAEEAAKVERETRTVGDSAAGQSTGGLDNSLLHQMNVKFDRFEAKIDAVPEALHKLLAEFEKEALDKIQNCIREVQGLARVGVHLTDDASDDESENADGDWVLPEDNARQSARSSSTTQLMATQSARDPPPSRTVRTPAVEPPAAPTIPVPSQKRIAAINTKADSFQVRYVTAYDPTQGRDGNLPDVDIPSLESLVSSRDVYRIVIESIPNWIELNSRHGGSWRGPGSNSPGMNLYQKYTTVLTRIEKHPLRVTGLKGDEDLTNVDLVCLSRDESTTVSDEEMKPLDDQKKWKVATRTSVAAMGKFEKGMARVTLGMENAPKVPRSKK